MASDLHRKAIIVSNIIHEGERRGYKLFIAGLGVKNVFLNKITKYPFKNIDIENAKFTGSDLQGTYLSLDKYPVVSMDNIIQKQGIVAFACILDKTNQKPIGAVVLNPLGNMYNVTFINLKLMMQKYPAINFKFDYDKDTNEYIVALDGSEFPTIEKTAPKKVYYNSVVDANIKTGNKVIQNTEKDMPVIEITEFDDVKGSDILSRANATIVDVDANLNTIAPYYFVMSRQIPKIPTTSIDTMAVNESEMVYNPDFLASLTVSEATFIIIHEMLHIAMSHSVRFDPLTMDAKLWNIACDMYINATIERDFGVTSHGSEHKIDIKDKSNQVVESGYIKMPAFGTFIEDYGLQLDFAKDSPETLYAMLAAENKAPQLPQQGGQGGQSSQDQQGDQDQQNGQGQGQQNQQIKLGKQDQQQPQSSGGNQPPTPKEISDLFDGIRMIRECLAKKDFVHSSDGMGKVQEAVDNMRKKGMLD